jgi:hypothetical protein
MADYSKRSLHAHWSMCSKTIVPCTADFPPQFYITIQVIPIRVISNKNRADKRIQSKVSKFVFKNTIMNWTVKKKKTLYYKFISKQRIISLMHDSILRRIWFNFMALCLVSFFGSSSFPNFFFLLSNFFDLSITEETLFVEMRIWCIKTGIVLFLQLKDASSV